MSNGSNKILSILLYVLMGISALLGVLFYSGSVSTDVIMYWCYALLGLGVVAAVVFAIVNMIRSPKGAKSAVIGVVALLAVFGISYGLAGDEMNDVYAEFISGPEASKRVGMGLIAFYILGIGAIAVTVFSGVSKLFK